jgi:hypothetical protein
MVQCLVRRRCGRAAVIAAVAVLSVSSLHAQNLYRAADAYADAAPARAEESIPALAAYLARSGRDDLTRTRAVYRWVAQHIEYDAQGFRTGHFGDLSAEAVLRRRVAVCDGYSQLVKALGVAMGLDVEVVRGWSKGYSYAPGMNFSGEPNHSWNAVRIDGRWRLLDATWGSGYLDESLRFFRDFQDHYFLTPPDAFVFDHFPADPRWQLVDRQLTMAEFTDLVYLRPMFFQAGFRVVSHSHARIAADDRVTVTLGVTRPVEVSAELVDPVTNQPVKGEFAFAQVDGVHAEISAAFPHAGEYIIRVFAKARDATGPLGWVLDYRVDAARGARNAAFPSPYRDFSSSGAWLFESLDGVLDVRKSYRFRLRAPGAIEVMVATGARHTLLSRSGDEFSGEMSVPAGETVVYAKYAAGDEYVGLLRYVGR